MEPRGVPSVSYDSNVLNQVLNVLWSDSNATDTARSAFNTLLLSTAELSSSAHYLCAWAHATNTNRVCVLRVQIA